MRSPFPAVTGRAMSCLQHIPACLFVAAGLFAPTATAQAQVSGRWVVTLAPGSPATTRGELRLVLTGTRLTGTFWLGEANGPAPIRGARIVTPDSIDFAAGSLHLTGRLSADGELRGRVSGAGRDVTEWVAIRLADDTEYYPALPRFTVHGVVTGRADSLLRIPGPWLAAAAADQPADALAGAYARAAAAAGVPALSGDSLAIGAPLRAMGVMQRRLLVAAASHTLESMRAGIDDPGVLLRFDRLFRPRGVWQVDLHDVALSRARAAGRALEATDAAPALVAAGWLPRERAQDQDAVLLALYRLFVLRSSDSTAAAATFAAMRDAEPDATRALLVLLGGYESARAWYADAIRFFLDEPWLGRNAGSIGDRVRAAWGDSTGSPPIEPRLFGYPQAVPRYGVPDALFEQLVRPENWSAGEWLRRHGRGGFLVVLHRVALEYGPAATLVLRSETLRLASPRGLTGEDGNGFLEARDVIELDPGYSPLLAIGAVVHEWQHLLFQRRIVVAPASVASGPVVIPGVDPYIAEGLAEWRAERILAPVIARFPLLGLAEVEKRARVARARPDDQHVLGYRLVRALSSVIGDDQRLVALLAVAAVASDGEWVVLRDPAVARAWSAHAGEPGLTVTAPSRRALVPELTFTIEDDFPDLVRSRIVAP